MDASQFIHTIEKRRDESGLPEEIGYRNKWLSAEGWRLRRNA